LFWFVCLGWCEEDRPGGIIAGGDQRKEKEDAPVGNRFPEAMCVLVVDDNPVCLKALEVFLRCCKYTCELKCISPHLPQYIRMNGHIIFISMATTTMMLEVRTSLNMPTDRGEEKFDLVVIDVHIPYMEGFDLLEFIFLEMDLPVIINYTLLL
jgi:two-component response regulator (ARR-B family)